MSLVERVLARPTLIIAVVVAVITLILCTWIVVGFKDTPEVPKVVAKAPPVSTADHLLTESVASDVIASTTQESNLPVPTSVSTPLPTDPALAAEELDRLNDESSRLQDRKAQLAKQLDTSNKLLALKEQQIKELEKNPL